MIYQPAFSMHVSVMEEGLMGKGTQLVEHVRLFFLWDRRYFEGTLKDLVLTSFLENYRDRIGMRHVAEHRSKTSHL